MNLCVAFKKSGFLYLLVLPVLFSCAQTKPSIIKTRAFCIEWSPGNIMVGQDGEPVPGRGPKLIYIVYAEAGDASIQWDSAKIENKISMVTPELVTSDTIAVGLENGSEKPMTISKDPQNYLWKITLNESGNNVIDGQLKAADQIMLYGTINGKKITHTASQVKKLVSLPSY